MLEGKTKGYRNHPQLLCFKNYSKPLSAINTYLFYVKEEGSNRGFGFGQGKIAHKLVDKKIKTEVSQGQLDYGLQLLRSKLSKRSKKKFEETANLERGANDLFTSYMGPIERWGKIKKIN